MKPSDDPSDRLIDSLIREEVRGHADDDLLASIEAKLDREPLAAAAPGRWKSLNPLLAVAALVMLLAAAALFVDARRTLTDAREIAGRAVPPPAVVVADPVVDPVVEVSPAPEDVAPAVVAEAPPLPEPPPAQMAMVSADVDPAPELASVVRAIPAENDKPSAAQAILAGRGNGAGSPGSFGDGWGGPVAGKGRGGSFPLSAGFAARAEGRDAEFALRERKSSAWTEEMGRENYGRLVDQPWKSPWSEGLSTFSVDVDTASYTNLRRIIMEGGAIQPDAVRIEECLNFFDYAYAAPQGDGPFAVHSTVATCPWKEQHLLVRVAVKGREVQVAQRPASNLVFLVDVSGSMQDPAKLPLVKRSMRMLIDQLDERDRVGIVVYAGSQGVVLEPTALDQAGKAKAIAALEKLDAGGSTNGGAGIKRAYELASKHLVAGGINRVILASDGDFNVGTTGQGQLVTLVKKGAANGVNLTVLGFGVGNFNDAMLEAITNEGNGNYFYIDNDSEARRVFLQKLTGTLMTIAKDVKIQIEFNPAKVQSYRLIGYANRILRAEDFADDKVDAGDIGAGHTVTAFYEVVPVGVPAPDTGLVDALRYQRPVGQELVPSGDWLTLKLRHKHPQGSASVLKEMPVSGEPLAWEQAGDDFRFAAAVALFGMKLRQFPETVDMPWSKIDAMARPALAEDPHNQRAGFLELLGKLR